MKLRLLIVGLLAALLALLAGPGTAQAAPGTIWAQVTCSSQSYVTVNFQNMTYGTTKNYAQPICSNWGEGGWSTNLQGHEPLSFHTGPGWCTSWNINDGPSNITRGGGTGIWQGIHPGGGFTGSWVAKLTAFDC